MNLTVLPSRLSGEICAPVSKSAAHRLLICAALADAPTEIECDGTNADIEATIGCLCALGAQITRSGDRITVFPISVNTIKNDALPDPAFPSVLLNCGESGSTERFLLPIVCALGVCAELIGQGRLANRPLSPLYEVLTAHGALLSENGKLPLRTGGKLAPGEFEIDGSVSSQFISGLLFALPLLNAESTLRITGKIESAHYIEMTLAALAEFGIRPICCENTYIFPKGVKYCTPKVCHVEGDWSSAAFFLAAGAVGRAPITCTGLDLHSLQGDRSIFSLLAEFGANCSIKDGKCTVAPNDLHGIHVDGTHIPDLIPILSVVAAFAEGDSVFEHISRLRMKESDRVAAIRDVLNTMGISSEATEDCLIVHGGSPHGGIFRSHNDHRIVMSAAIAASAVRFAAEGESRLLDVEAVQKSYPRFFEDFRTLGGTAYPSC